MGNALLRKWRTRHWSYILRWHNIILCFLLTHETFYPSLEYGNTRCCNVSQIYVRVQHLARSHHDTCIWFFFNNDLIHDLAFGEQPISYFIVSYFVLEGSTLHCFYILLSINFTFLGYWILILLSSLSDIYYTTVFLTWM